MILLPYLNIDFIAKKNVFMDHRYLTKKERIGHMIFDKMDLKRRMCASFQMNCDK